MVYSSFFPFLKMTSLLPPALLKLFAPRPPLPYLPPIDQPPDLRSESDLSGVAAFLPFCKGHDPDYVPTETVAAKMKRVVLFKFYDPESRKKGT